jgi:hypothetical protein
MADIVIFIRGGTFQGAVTDTSGGRLMIVDYDDEATGDCQRRFDPVEVVDDLAALLDQDASAQGGGSLQ